MTIGVFIIIIIVYLLLVLLLYQMGQGKKIGGFKLALISLLCTPIIGMIVFYMSESRMVAIEQRYKCPVCKYEFTESHDVCPHCESLGKNHKLERVNRNMV